MKVITWNSEGLKAGSIQTLLKDEAPDVLVLQEVGNMEDYVNGPWQFEHAYRLNDQIVPSEYYGWWCPWARDQAGQGNIRCSMAMFWKKSLSDAAGAPTIIPAEEQKRMVMRKLLDGVHVFNIHAGGKVYVCEAVQIAKTNRKYMVAGDFNQEYDLVAGVLQAGGVSTDGVNIVSTRPDDFTRPKSRKIIDYGITNIDGGSARLCRLYDPSDHKSVCIEFG